MSENQGFRIGEIIRYVTGNVPSSATAMYYLFLRKLQRHCGNLRVTGKIAADHKILHRTNHILESVGYLEHVLRTSGSDVEDCPKLPQYVGQKELTGASGIWIPASSADPYGGTNNVSLFITQYCRNSFCF